VIEIVLGTLLRRLSGLSLATGLEGVSFRLDALDFCVAGLPVRW
jgi:hypothetical protein